MIYYIIIITVYITCALFSWYIDKFNTFKGNLLLSSQSDTGHINNNYRYYKH